MSLWQACANGAAEGFIIALAALGITLVFGLAQFANAAQGDYLTLGAYATLVFVQTLGLPVPLAGLLGLIVCVAVGLGFYRLAFKPLAGRPAASLIVSIGVALTVRHVIIFIAGTDQYTYGLPLLRAWVIGGLRIFPLDVLFVGLSLAAITATHLFLTRTELGRQMRAVADDAELAKVSGLPAARVHLATWILVMSLSGLAGVMLAAKTVVDPYLGWEFLLPAFAAAILGGLGSPYGAVLGGLIIGLSQELTVLYWSETYKQAASFLVIGAVLLVRPSGLLGRREVVR